MDFNKWSKFIKENDYDHIKETVTKGKEIYDQYVQEETKELLQGEFFKQEERLLHTLENGMKENEETVKFREFINRPLRITSNDRKAIEDKKMISPEVIGAGSITFADYFYSMSQIDPDFVKAIDFNQTDLSMKTFEEVRRFVENSFHLPSPSTKGMEDSSKLNESIHVPLGITKDMKAGIKEVSKLFLDDSSSSTEGEEVDSFSALESAGDGMSSAIPIIALASSSYRAFRKVKTNEMTTEEALKYVAVDTIAVSAGSFVGNKVGFVVGSMLAPATGGISLVIGPIIGSMMGIYVARKLVQIIRKSEVKRYYQKLEQSLYDLSNETIQRKELIKAFINETISEQRTLFRTKMLEAFRSDGTKLLVDRPSNNYILLSEIGKRYRDDSQSILQNRNRLSRNVFHVSHVQGSNQLHEVIPHILENRGLFEEASPDLHPYYEKALEDWHNYNRVKAKYS